MLRLDFKSKSFYFIEQAEFCFVLDTQIASLFAAIQYQQSLSYNFPGKSMRMCFKNRTNRPAGVIHLSAQKPQMSPCRRNLPY